MMAYIVSKKFDFISQDFRKVLVGAAVAGTGAFLTYLLEGIQGVDFGSSTPIVVALLSIGVNAFRKFISTTIYK